MRALVARSARGKCWYWGILRAIAKAMMLNRNTAKTVKDNTANTSQADQGGKRRGGAAAISGSTGDVCTISGGTPRSADTIGEGSGRLSLGSGNGLNGRDMMSITQ